MALLYNAEAFLADIIGCPSLHKMAFLDVASAEQSTILVRATGPTCLQLLEQGYDTKGFRIHGKSCDWGPMAGFVLRDPRLNKSGMLKANYNRREHAEAITDARSGANWHASTTPLRLHDERVQWLINNNHITPIRRTDDRYEGVASHPTGVRFYYSLIKVGTQQLGDMWGVYIDREKSKRVGFVQERGNTIVKYDTKYKDMYEPLLAMTNPVNHRQFQEEHPLNAITGDYDLFAIWPQMTDYNFAGDDRRVLGTVHAWSRRDHIANNLERNFTTGGQGTKLGNITNRIYRICQILNARIGSLPTWEGNNFPRRNVLWHSDEAARPFVNDVDLPVVAYMPNMSYVIINTIDDFKNFIAISTAMGMQVTLAEGWALNPSANKPNRLGNNYQGRVPGNWPGQQWRVPNYYNR